MIINPYNGVLPIRKFVTGAYVGDETETKNINLGFRPRAVLVASSGGIMGYMSGSAPAVYGGLALQDMPVATSGGTALELTDTGFAVHYISGNGYVRTNRGGDTYYYIALA